MRKAKLKEKFENSYVISKLGNCSPHKFISCQYGMFDTLNANMFVCFPMLQT
jgi:hypothetical protein